MNKNTIKTNLLLFLRKLGLKIATAIILTLTAVATVYVYAAFTEPAAGPAASVQDFVQNILGANNADNAFSSSSVVANADGSVIERQEYIAEKVGPLITSSDCTTAGWQWDDTQEVCVSPRMYITNRTTWNACGSYTGWTNGADNASSTPTFDNPTHQIYGSTIYLPQYTCLKTTATSTLVQRMTSFAQFAGSGAADTETWGGLIQMGNREIDNAQHKNWSALAVADCVDGVKDLGKYYHPAEGCPGNIAACSNYTYHGEYSTRNNMLAGWAGASGSHLPMPAEYEKACLNLLNSGDWPATDVGEGAWLWSAAVGGYSGNYWSEHARLVGNSSCGSQNYGHTGYPTNSLRVFFRP